MDPATSRHSNHPVEGTESWADEMEEEWLQVVASGREQPSKTTEPMQLLPQIQHEPGPSPTLAVKNSLSKKRTATASSTLSPGRLFQGALAEVHRNPPIHRGRSASGDRRKALEQERQKTAPNIPQRGHSASPSSISSKVDKRVSTMPISNPMHRSLKKKSVFERAAHVRDDTQKSVPERDAEAVPLNADSIHLAAKKLIQTVVHFQAEDQTKLEHFVAQVHRLANVEEAAIQWIRQVPTEKPIQLFRYYKPDVASRVRKESSRVYEENHRQFDYGPIENQLECQQVSQLGTQVYRGERTLMHLFEREAFPGLVLLWAFILDFSVSKLERGLDFYYRMWKSSDKNLAFLNATASDHGTLRMAILNESDFDGSSDIPSPCSWQTLVTESMDRLRCTLHLACSDRDLLLRAIEISTATSADLVQQFARSGRWRTTSSAFLWERKGKHHFLTSFPSVEQFQDAQRHATSVRGVECVALREEAIEKQLEAFPELLLLHTRQINA